MKLPRFTDLVVDFDFHMHTEWTDGHASPDAMIDAASRRGLRSVAITEHVRRDSDWFPAFRDGILALKRVAPLELLLGIEAKALDYQGTIDASPDTIAAAELVVGVVHRYPQSDGSLARLDDIAALDPHTAAEVEFRAAMGLLRNREVHVLGHPFGVYHRFHGGFPLDRMEQLIVAATSSGVAIEINTKYSLDDGFLALLKRHDPTVSVGSDAHDPSEIARSFDELRGRLSSSW